MKSLNSKILITIAALTTLAQVQAKLGQVNLLSEQGQARAYDENGKVIASADQHFGYNLEVSDTGVSFNKQSGWFGTDVASIFAIKNMGNRDLTYVIRDYNNTLAEALRGTIKPGDTKTLPNDTHVPWQNSGQFSIAFGATPTNVTFTVNQ